MIWSRDVGVRTAPKPLPLHVPVPEAVVLLGVTSYAFTWEIGVPGQALEPRRPPSARLDAFGLLDRAVTHRVSVVQLLDNLPLGGLADDELERLADRARELGIDLEIGTRGIDPEHLRRYLGIARRLGSPLVRIVVDTAARKPTEREVTDSLRLIVSEFEAAGINLAIENHDRFDTAMLLRILAALDSPHAGICLDTVNSLGCLERPEVVVAALGPHTISLHIKDFEVRRAWHAMGLSVDGTPAGDGRLDIPWLLAELHSMGRDPNALLELWTPPETDLAATVAKEQAWTARSLAYLRELIPA